MSDLPALPSYAELIEALRIVKFRSFPHKVPLVPGEVRAIRQNDFSKIIAIIERFEAASGGAPTERSSFSIIDPANYKRARPPALPLADRLWAKVTKAGPDECWIWNGSRVRNQHGVLTRGGRGASRVYAHVASWELTHGKVPTGMYVCHKCDNPPCVNPKHLFVGTAGDNHADMGAKLRSNLGEKNAFAKLTSEDVREIRRLSNSPMPQKEIAARFNVKRETIRLIVRGISWRHVV